MKFKFYPTLLAIGLCLSFVQASSQRHLDEAIADLLATTPEEVQRQRHHPQNEIQMVDFTQGNPVAHLGGFKQEDVVDLLSYDPERHVLSAPFDAIELTPPKSNLKEHINESRRINTQMIQGLAECYNVTLEQQQQAKTELETYLTPFTRGPKIEEIVDEAQD